MPLQQHDHRQQQQRGNEQPLVRRPRLGRFVLVLRGNAALQPLGSPRLQRGIGVIRLPESERVSHYFETRLLRQFDAIVHFDQTRAVEPLEPGATWAIEETPETYPSGT